MDRSKAEDLLVELEAGGRTRLGKRDAMDALKSLIERLDATLSRAVRFSPRGRALRIHSGTPPTGTSSSTEGRDLGGHLLRRL